MFQLMLRCNLKNLRATIKTDCFVRGLVFGLCFFNFFLSISFGFGAFSRIQSLYWRVSFILVEFISSTTDDQIAESVYHVNMMSFYFYLMEKQQFSGQKFKGESNMVFGRAIIALFIFNFFSFGLKSDRLQIRHRK